MDLIIARRLVTLFIVLPRRKRIYAKVKLPKTKFKLPKFKKAKPKKAKKVDIWKRK